MSDLVTRAQLILLSRALSTAPEQVRFLEKLGADDLRRLRERLSGILFDEQSEQFHRIAALAKFVPSGIAAKIAELAVAPIVAGRAAGLVPTDKAVALVSKLSTAYMADASPEIDPRSVAHIVPHLPIAPLVAVGKSLMERGDFVTLSRYISYTTAEQIRAVEDSIDDNEGLVQVSFYVENAEDVDRVVSVLTPQRVAELVRTAATTSDETRLAGLSLLGRVNDGMKTRLGDIAFDQGNEVVTMVLDTAVREGALAEVLAVSAHLSPSSLDMAAANPVLAEPKVTEAFIHTAAEHGLWAGLLVVTERMSKDLQRQGGRVLAELDEETLAQLARDATELHFWPVTLNVLANQDKGVQQKIGAAWQELHATDRTALEHYARDLGLQDALKPLLRAAA